MAKFCLLILIGGFLVSDTNSEYTYEAPQSVDGQTWNVVDDSTYYTYSAPQETSNEIHDYQQRYGSAYSKSDVIEERQAGIAGASAVAGPIISLAVGGANFAYTQSQVGANSDQIDTLESTISTLRNTINQLQTDVTSLQSTQATIQTTLTAVKLKTDTTCTTLKPVTAFTAVLEPVEMKDTNTDTAATEVDNLLNIIRDMADLVSVCP